MKQVLYIDAAHEGYSPDQIRRTMTVGDFIAYLEQFDEDTPVYLRHDGGYTYGGITDSCFEDGEVAEDGDDEDDQERGFSQEDLDRALASSETRDEILAILNGDDE